MIIFFTKTFEVAFITMYCKGNLIIFLISSDDYDWLLFKVKWENCSAKYMSREENEFLFDKKDHVDICLVLDQHLEFDFFYCASSLKQQFTYRYVNPLGYNTQTPSQPIFVPTCTLNAVCFVEKKPISIL
jgi:hypothetical protein